MPDSGDLSVAKTARVARPAPNRRRLLFALLGVTVLVCGAGYGAYRLLTGARSVSTDDAYVGAEVAEVTPLVGGQVQAVMATETQLVRRGEPLVVLDPADARIAVDQARAALAQAERQVQGYFANDSALAAQVAGRRAAIQQSEAQIASTRADLERARTDLTRRQALASSGAVSGDELTNAQNRFSEAQAALAAAQAARQTAEAGAAQASGSRRANLALIAGTSVADNPDVLAARARLAAAQLALARTVITAPVDGVVTKKAVEVGQQVQPGMVTMQIVPTRRMYVDANFKEVQLARVHPGQPVILTGDLYGGKVKFHGRVSGLSGGTGAAFSLVPAQNASGNWIKIVQRLPVRITLDPAELARHPLRVGLSMKATIDVSKT
ncbi:MAG: HlyD family efflux transporter periplasmic adaptor subunit [Caulobacteraceae bacterium]|nr:HlyD family efflux transporter periplasmic adaptor subunit [Caulobacteraceae bacterium]